jgi:hypothetical protein
LRIRGDHQHSPSSLYDNKGHYCEIHLVVDRQTQESQSRLEKVVSTSYHAVTQGRYREYWLYSS